MPLKPSSTIFWFNLHSVINLITLLKVKPRIVAPYMRLTYTIWALNQWQRGQVLWRRQGERAGLKDQDKGKARNKEMTLLKKEWIKVGRHTSHAVLADRSSFFFPCFSFSSASLKERSLRVNMKRNHQSEGAWVMNDSAEQSPPHHLTLGWDEQEITVC